MSVRTAGMLVLLSAWIVAVGWFMNRGMAW